MQQENSCERTCSFATRPVAFTRINGNLIVFARNLGNRVYGGSERILVLVLVGVMALVAGCGGSSNHQANLLYLLGGSGADVISPTRLIACASVNSHSYGYSYLDPEGNNLYTVSSQSGYIAETSIAHSTRSITIGTGLKWVDSLVWVDLHEVIAIGVVSHENGQITTYQAGLVVISGLPHAHVGSIVSFGQINWIPFTYSNVVYGNSVMVVEESQLTGNAQLESVNIHDGSLGSSMPLGPVIHVGDRWNLSTYGNEDVLYGANSSSGSGFLISPQSGKITGVLNVGGAIDSVQSNRNAAVAYVLVGIGPNHVDLVVDEVNESSNKVVGEVQIGSPRGIPIALGLTSMAVDWEKDVAYVAAPSGIQSYSISKVSIPGSSAIRKLSVSLVRELRVSGGDWLAFAKTEEPSSCADS